MQGFRNYCARYIWEGSNVYISLDTLLAGCDALLCEIDGFNGNPSFRRECKSTRRRRFTFFSVDAARNSLFYKTAICCQSQDKSSHQVRDEQKRSPMTRKNPGKCVFSLAIYSHAKINIPFFFFFLSSCQPWRDTCSP